MQQLPLNLPLRPRQAREDFVEGRANRTALQLIDLWPDWKASLAIIWGPQGSGKTHLASVWLEKSRGLRLVDDDWTAPELSANLLIEDADARKPDETAFFHALNEARQAGKSVLITARSLPASWDLSLPDLISRLAAATIVELEEPDDALLSAVLAKHFADRQLAVEATVIAFLVSRMERSLASAAAIVDRLDQLSLERQTRISRALAALVVRDSDPLQAELDI